MIKSVEARFKLYVMQNSNGSLKFFFTPVPTRIWYTYVQTLRSSYSISQKLVDSSEDEQSIEVKKKLIGWKFGVVSFALHYKVQKKYCTFSRACLCRGIWDRHRDRLSLETLFSWERIFSYRRASGLIRDAAITECVYNVYIAALLNRPVFFFSDAYVYALLLKLAVIIFSFLIYRLQLRSDEYLFHCILFKRHQWR